MATLKIFISSTCYDLGVVRSKLQEFFHSLGYDPILSEYSDVVFDHRTHTHTSCIDEVGNCDAMVLLIGSRFGGKAVPEARARIDLAKVNAANSNALEMDTLSITQLEVVRAIELKLPVFVFVDDRVLHDHLVYEKNKQKACLPDITFPSIERPESATYIFEFINFLRHRNTGNAVTGFTRIDDIELHLRKQWSGLFQRLLRDDRMRSAENERARQVQEQLDELKTAILSSIQAPEAREVARAVIRYRALIEFVTSLGLQDIGGVLLSEKLTWAYLVEQAKINRIAVVNASALPTRTYFIFKDDAYFAVRMPFHRVSMLSEAVVTFARLSRDIQEATLDAWEEYSVSDRPRISPTETTFTQLMSKAPSGAVVQYYDARDLSRPPEEQVFRPAKVEVFVDDDIPF